LIDKVVLELLLKETLSQEDFAITKDGYCRLNLQLARKLVQAVATFKVAAI
jgi:hypothetical protein